MKRLSPLIFVAGILLLSSGLIIFSYGLLSVSTRSARELDFWCGCGCILLGGILITLSSLMRESLTIPEGLERVGGIESLPDSEPFQHFGGLEDLREPKAPEGLTSVERLERMKGLGGFRRLANRMEEK